MSGLLHELSDLLHGLLDWVESFAKVPYAGWALAAISFAESSFFPIPPDALLIPLCLARPELSFWFAFVCSVASVLGGIAGYGIGQVGGRPLIRRMFSRERVEAVSRYYDRYNAWATGIAGLTPLPYKIFTLSGGAFGIDFKVFVLASILARSLRFFAVATLIYFYGEPAKAFIDRHLGWLTIAFVILLAGGFWLMGRAAKRAGSNVSDATDEGGS